MGSERHVAFARLSATQLLNKRLPSHYDEQLHSWPFGQYDPLSLICIAVIIDLEALSDIGRIAESTGGFLVFTPVVHFD